ncbi:PREDICTED: ankyrin repeat and SAM domain-containing protein 6-like [Priapulus caudatus]|uniref:Ankyrin repeat and SAM domain-containing protein 6-like n=1 Tax=Priapulus caudatus TaxID=37621 RepID=A0ABM1F340_PRICU|nr:PREDICTED: ankyrin repeat and SAM domain-containing protein 6-like [Priapulus caudatus]
MDTDVVRMLAASMVKATKPAPAQQQQQQQQQKLGGLQQAWQPGISSSTPMLTTVGSEDGEHGGLKAWWSRMSNRFHQLKLMRTFRFSSNQLAPLPVALDDEGPSPRGAGRDDSLDTSLLDSINTLLLDTAHSSMMSLGNIGAAST